MKVLTPIPPTPFPRKRRKGEQIAPNQMKLFSNKGSQVQNSRPLKSIGRGGGGVRGLLFTLTLLLLALPVHAQSTPQPVTYDNVNAIAEKMYCPECENIPLDQCNSPVCVQWKGEIADQLAAGRSEQEIIDGFVARFGDQVLSIPQDPTLRNISLLSPYIFAGMIFIIGVWTFLRWRGSSQPEAPAPKAPEDDRYRSRLENDLRL